MGYSHGMVKIEAFDNSHFMHQTIRVCHTDHPDSTDNIIACIACSLKRTLVILDYKHHFMHQTT